MTNSSGRLLESYQYDAFGKLQRYDSSNNPLASSLAGNRFGFTGQEWDSATNSYRFFYRNYSTESGVFNQRDLIEYKDGMGMYQYVGNNPANGVDVWGLEDCPPYRREEAAYKVSFFNEVVLTLLEKGAKAELHFKTLHDLQSISNSKFEYRRLMEKSIHERFNRGNKTFANYHSSAANSHMQNIKASEANIAETTANIDGANGKGLKAFGDGLNVLDNLVKGEAFASSLVDGEGNEQHTQEWQAGGDFALSLLSWTGPGAVYGTLDFTVETLTGKGITQHTADLGNWLGEQSVTSGTQIENDAWDYASSQGRGGDWLRAKLRMEEKIRQHQQKKNDCPEGGTLLRPRYVWDPITGELRIVWPEDPNEIVGPSGVDDKKWVSINDR
ncbi:MAG: RHS repeat-associated core domain-containing protein, partial [Chitinophagaceae bacterium]